MKILFITLSNIGDTILTLGVLSSLKNKFPESFIDVVVGPRPKEIFTKDKRIRYIFTYNKKASFKEKILFLKALKKQRYDLAVDMRNTFIPFLIGVKRVPSLFYKKSDNLKHKKDIHLDKLKILGIRNTNNKRNIYIEKNAIEKIDIFFNEKNIKKNDVLIGISPFCMTQLKEWGNNNVIAIIKRILEKDRYKILLLGDAGKKEISIKLEKAIGNKNLINCAGKFNLNELFPLIDKLDLLLTSDSACMHIAGDLGKRIIALFGPTDSEEYGPRGENDIIIKKDLKCSPCKKAECKFNHECMDTITVDEVLLEILRSSRRMIS